MEDWIGYLFIDESGDLGENGSEYLVLAALMVRNPRLLERIIKDMRRNRFRKELGNVSEIKANKSSDEIRVYMLRKLNSVGSAKVTYAVLEKSRLVSRYLKRDKNELYNFVAGKLAENLQADCSAIQIRVDKSKGKQLLRNDFDEIFIRKLNLGKKRKATIEHSHSHNWAGLQFADLLAWACFQKFERRNPRYVELILIERRVFILWD